MMHLLRRAGARRLCVTVIAAAAMLAPRAADAFCRTTTTPIPANYSPTRGCFVDGLALFWKGGCISYSLNSKASTDITLTEATSVIDAAFNSWNRAACAGGTQVGILTSNIGPTSCGKVGYNVNGPNQNVIVFRDDAWPYSDPNNTLGLTTVTFNADNGEIFDADMEINSSGKNLSTSPTVPANGFDLLSVITHEAGHFLGLAHATDSKATMFASYKPGTSALRTLTPDDIAGICEIYPDTTKRAVDTTIEQTGFIAADACDPTPRHGFSASTCEPNPEPKQSSSGGCAVVGGEPSGELQGAGLVALGLTLAVATRRRRRPQGSLAS
jgi:MYXO-CTERM domain-containing protein